MPDQTPAATSERIRALRCPWGHVTLWPDRLHPLPDECPAVLRREGRADLVCGQELTPTRTLYGAPQNGRQEAHDG